ncbi:MAG: DNA methyltransferase [Chloroflexi bacterium]|nr:DNA methyltransferase [Chloroflexota bacterium]
MMALPESNNAAVHADEPQHQDNPGNRRIADDYGGSAPGAVEDRDQSGGCKEPVQAVEDWPAFSTLSDLNGAAAGTTKSSAVTEPKEIEFHEIADIWSLLGDAELALLAANIKQHGLLDPICLYEGKILDGRNRYRACAIAGVEPVTRLFGGSYEAAVEFALAVNRDRRHADPSMRAAAAHFAQTKLGSRLKAEAKEQQESQGTRGVEGGRGKKKPLGNALPKGLADGRKTDAKLAAAAGTNREYVRSARKLEEKRPDLLLEVKAGKVTIPRATRKMRDDEADAKRKAKPKPPSSVPDPDLRLGEFQQVLADVPDGSIDLILTDPPYPQKFLSLWTALAIFAKRVLKPTGMLAAMSGQTHLPEVYVRLGEHLIYRWTMTYLIAGRANVQHQRKVTTQWKPVLVYGPTKRRFHDVVKSDAEDKRYHDWGQSESGMLALLQQLADTGAVVLDPFLGGGTTGIAANEHKCTFIGAESVRATYEAACARLL